MDTRENIIKRITDLYSIYGYACTECIESMNYEEVILEGLREKHSDKDCAFKNIPLCWYGPYSYQNSSSWVELVGFEEEDGVIYAGISNWHSGPPDYEWFDLEEVPDTVLLSAINIIESNIQSIKNK